MQQTSTISEIMKDKELVRNQGVFILSPGSHQAIIECSQQGMSLLIPNQLMSPELIIQTFTRLNRKILITSREIWNLLRKIFESSARLSQEVSVMIFP